MAPNFQAFSVESLTEGLHRILTSLAGVDGLRVRSDSVEISYGLGALYGCDLSSNGIMTMKG